MGVAGERWTYAAEHDVSKTPGSILYATEHSLVHNRTDARANVGKGTRVWISELHFATRKGQNSGPCMRGWDIPCMRPCSPAGLLRPGLLILSSIAGEPRLQK